MVKMTRNDIKLALISAGLTYSAEQEPVYMRERTLDEVVDVVMSMIETSSHE